MLDEFKIINHSIQQLWVNLQEFWTLPPKHSYKVNVDRVVFAHIQQAGVSVVIRNHMGKETAAMSKKIHQLLGPLEIEAKAM